MPSEDSVTPGGRDELRRQGLDSRSLLQSRRDMVRHGVKLAFVAPVMSTFFAGRAYAANYSCYPLDHGCDFDSETKRQACCDALVCKTAGGNPVGPGESGTCKP